MRSWCWHDWTPWRTYTGSFERQWAGPSNRNSISTTETRQARRCNKCHREQHVLVENADGLTYEGAAFPKPPSAPDKAA